MTHRIYAIFLACLAALCIIPSCKPQSDVEEVSLQVGSHELSFSREAAERSISVTTTADSWSYFSPQEFDWVHLTQSGNDLRVQVDANTQGRERSSLVIISSGGQQRRVVIRQSAADILITPELSAIELPVSGGSRTIAFESNATGVKVELAVPLDWITIDRITATSFTFTAKPNAEGKTRSAKINLSLGATLREIDVTQLAENAAKYLLPLLKFPASLSDVLAFESARGSFLVKTPDGIYNKDAYRFRTNSSLIPVVEYVYGNEFAKVHSAATLLSPDASAFKDNEEFVAILKDLGMVHKTHFTLNNGDEMYFYEMSDPTYTLEITYMQAGGAKLVFRYYSVQDKPYETFKELPMSRLIPKLGNRRLEIMGASMDEVRKFEAEELKGVRNEQVNVPYYDFFVPSTPLEGEIFRAYSYVAPSEDKTNPIPKDDPYVGHCTLLHAEYQDANLAYYFDHAGKPVLTKEFVAFMQSKGYAYFTKLTSGAEIFYNADTRLAYSVAYTHAISREDHLDIKALYMIAKKRTSIQSLLNDQEYFAQRAALKRQLIHALQPSARTQRR